MLVRAQVKWIMPAVAAALLGFFAAETFAQNFGGTVRRGTAVAAPQRPNIVVIWGDDIGESNISAYSLGLMGYRTPNIDRDNFDRSQRSMADGLRLRPFLWLPGG